MPDLRRVAGAQAGLPDSVKGMATKTSRTGRGGTRTTRRTPARSGASRGRRPPARKARRGPGPFSRALLGDVPVVTISQWGAHEAVYWGTETVTGPKDWLPLVTSFGRALRDRPTFKVHLGGQVDLSDLSADRPGDAMRAHKRIMQAITNRLKPLRADEPDVPRFHDPTRPTDTRSPWRP